MGKSSARNGSNKPADRIVVRRSGVHGRGVFTRRRIRKGARIIEYVGRHLPWKEAQDAPPLDPKNPHHTMLFSLDNGDVIDATVGGNESRWINHSCDPNCEAIIEETIAFCARAAGIAAGRRNLLRYKMIRGSDGRRSSRKSSDVGAGRRMRGTMLEPRKVKGELGTRRVKAHAGSCRRRTLPNNERCRLGKCRG